MNNIHHSNYIYNLSCKYTSCHHTVVVMDSWPSKMPTSGNSRSNSENYRQSSNNNNSNNNVLLDARTYRYLSVMQDSKNGSLKR